MYLIAKSKILKFFIVLIPTVFFCSSAKAQSNLQSHPNKNHTLIIQPNGQTLPMPKVSTSDTHSARRKKPLTQNPKKLHSDTLNKKGKKPIQKSKPLAPRLPAQPGSTLIYKQN